MRSLKLLYGLVHGVLLVCMLAVPSHAEKIPQKEVPDAVLSAFERTYPNAKVLSYAKEKRAGATVYEIESKEAQIRRDIIYSRDGNALEIEERIKPASLPYLVKEAIKKEYPNSRISSAERLTRGQAVQYETVIRSEGVSFEVVTDESGKVIKKEKLK